MAPPRESSSDIMISGANQMSASQAFFSSSRSSQVSTRASRIAQSPASATNVYTTARVGNVLIIVEAIDEKLFLAARNLPGVEVLAVGSVNPVSLAAHDKVLATVAAVKLIEERLQ